MQPRDMCFISAVVLLLLVESCQDQRKDEVVSQTYKTSRYAYEVSYIPVEHFITSRISGGGKDNHQRDSLLKIYRDKVFFNLKIYPAKDRFDEEKAKIKASLREELNSAGGIYVVEAGDTLMPDISYVVEDGNIRNFIECDLGFSSSTAREELLESGSIVLETGFDKYREIKINELIKK